MKKKTVIVLLLSLLLLLAAGCGGGTAVKEPSGTPSGEEEKVDFLGMPVRYAISGYLGFEPSSILADCARARVSQVEADMNCKINLLPDKDTVAVGYSVAAGQPIAEFCSLDSYMNADLIRNGMFYDLLEVSDQMDILGKPEKWGNSNQLTSFVWDSKLYGVIPLYYPESIYKCCDHAVFVNEDMITGELGMQDPRELVEKGEWSRKKFVELADTYTHTEGENTIYGVCFYSAHFYDMTLRTGGFEYAVKEDDGTWSSGFATTTAMNNIQWARDFMENHKSSVLTGTTFPMIEKFIAGQSAMIVTHVGYALETSKESSTSIAQHVKNYGILPFPLAESMPYGEWISQHESMTGFGMVADVGEPEDLALLLEALYEPFEEYATEEDRMNYYLSNLFHDKRDADVIFTMVKNTRYTYYVDGARNIVDALSSNAGKSIIEILSSHEKGYETVLENSLIPSYESVANIWGTK